MRKLTMHPQRLRVLKKGNRISAPACHSHCLSTFLVLFGGCLLIISTSNHVAEEAEVTLKCTGENTQLFHNFNLKNTQRAWSSTNQLNSPRVVIPPVVQHTVHRQ